jgi:hypothetical protein
MKEKKEKEKEKLFTKVLLVVNLIEMTLHLLRCGVGLLTALALVGTETNMNLLNVLPQLILSPSPDLPLSLLLLFPLPCLPGLFLVESGHLVDTLWKRARKPW